MIYTTCFPIFNVLIIDLISCDVNSTFIFSLIDVFINDGFTFFSWFYRHSFSSLCDHVTYQVTFHELVFYLNIY